MCLSLAHCLNRHRRDDGSHSDITHPASEGLRVGLVNAEPYAPRSSRSTSLPHWWGPHEDCGGGSSNISTEHKEHTRGFYQPTGHSNAGVISIICDQNSHGSRPEGALVSTARPARSGDAGSWQEAATSPPPSPPRPVHCSLPSDSCAVNPNAGTAAMDHGGKDASLVASLQACVPPTTRSNSTTFSNCSAATVVYGDSFGACGWQPGQNTSVSLLDCATPAPWGPLLSAADGQLAPSYTSEPALLCHPTNLGGALVEHLHEEAAPSFAVPSQTNHGRLMQSHGVAHVGPTLDEEPGWCQEWRRSLSALDDAIASCQVRRPNSSTPDSQPTPLFSRRWHQLLRDQALSRPPAVAHGNTESLRLAPKRKSTATASYPAPCRRYNQASHRELHSGRGVSWDSSCDRLHRHTGLPGPLSGAWQPPLVAGPETGLAAAPDHRGSRTSAVEQGRHMMWPGLPDQTSNDLPFGGAEDDGMPLGTCTYLEVDTAKGRPEEAHCDAPEDCDYGCSPAEVAFAAWSQGPAWH